MRPGREQPKAERRELQCPTQADIPETRRFERIQPAGAVSRLFQFELKVLEFNRRSDPDGSVRRDIRKGTVGFAASEKDPAKGGENQADTPLID